VNAMSSMSIATMAGVSQPSQRVNAIIVLSAA
jgi:hypothetical protein